MRYIHNPLFFYLRRRADVLVSIIFSFVFISCSDTGTDPPPKPAGYQEDIPWPSLANSPWPMFGGNPQNTGRSSGFGPVDGIEEWSIDTLFIKSGITLGADSTIYFLAGQPFEESSGLYAVSVSGSLKWQFKMNVSLDPITPVITSDGTIYINSPIEQKLYAINQHGNIKWTLNKIISASQQLTLGKDGTLYLIGNYLYAIDKNGFIRWQLDNFGLNDGISISPDGKTIYLSSARLASNNKAVWAMDIATQTIKWSYGKSILPFSPPLIDMDENIYIVTEINDNEGELVSLNRYGEERWSYSPKKRINGNYEHFAMDKLGNIYFGYDNLYSIDFNGQLRWKTRLDINNPISSAIIIDQNNNVYCTTGLGKEKKIRSVDSDGNKLCEIEIISDKNYPSFYAFAMGYSRLYYPHFENSLVQIIK